MRRREDVLDLRRHPGEKLSDALALGLRALSPRSDRGLTIMLDQPGRLAIDVVRQLLHIHRQLAREGRRCAIVMPPASAVATTLAYRATVPWVGSAEEAPLVLARADPTVRVRRDEPGRGLRATVSGALDAAGLRSIASELEAIAHFARTQREIVFDLAGLDFADAHGLEAITHTAVRAELSGARVRFDHARPQVRALAYRLNWHRHLPGLANATPGELPMGPGPDPGLSVGDPSGPERAQRSFRRAVIATAPCGDVMYWDERARDLYGWSNGEVLQRNIAELTVAPSDEQLAGAIMTEIRRSGAWEGEFPVRHRDDTTFCAHVRNAIIDDALGVPAGVVGFSRPLPSHDLCS